MVQDVVQVYIMYLNCIICLDLIVYGVVCSECKIVFIVGYGQVVQFQFGMFVQGCVYVLVVCWVGFEGVD